MTIARFSIKKMIYYVLKISFNEMFVIFAPNIVRLKMKIVICGIEDILVKDMLI